MELPAFGYRCHKAEFICTAGESVEEREASRHRDVHGSGRGCRYWCMNEAWGNCILRIDKECEVSEVAGMLGMSRQAVQMAEQRAIRKLAVRIGLLKEAGLLNF